MTTRETPTADQPPVEPADDSIRLRSTTVTTIHRESDGDTSVSVIHTARFTVKPGTVPDQKRKYGVHVFRPSWMEAKYRDGYLDEVSVTGPRVIKAGLSKKESGHFDWRRKHHCDEVDRNQLPDPIARALADYELAVAVETGDKK